MFKVRTGIIERSNSLKQFIMCPEIPLFLALFLSIYFMIGIAVNLKHVGNDKYRPTTLLILIFICALWTWFYHLIH